MIPLAQRAHGAGHTSLASLDATHRGALRALLERDTPTNLFALSWLEHYGVAPARPAAFHFRGLLDEHQRLCATALIISERLAILDALNPLDAALMGRWYCEAAFHFQHIVSARHIAEPFWYAYVQASSHTGQRPFSARLISPQHLYQMDRARWLDLLTSSPLHHPTSPIPLREANSQDLEPLFLASARMHLEETLEDPLELHPDTFRSHVRHRIDMGRSYVWFDEHRRLIFKADVSAQSRYGVQVSGVYTDPIARNQGVASRAMIELCRIFFARGWPRVTLYVNDSNLPAIKVYQRVGFVPHADYVTIFVNP